MDVAVEGTEPAPVTKVVMAVRAAAGTELSIDTEFVPLLEQVTVMLEMLLFAKTPEPFATEHV
jgi:hypothetical protein